MADAGFKPVQCAIVKSQMYLWQVRSPQCATQDQFHISLCLLDGSRMFVTFRFSSTSLYPFTYFSTSKLLLHHWMVNTLLVLFIHLCICLFHQWCLPSSVWDSSSYCRMGSCCKSGDLSSLCRSSCLSYHFSCGLCLCYFTSTTYFKGTMIALSCCILTDSFSLLKA